MEGEKESSIGNVKGYIYKHNIVVLGVGFLLVFISFNTLQNFLTTLLPGNTGFLSLSIIYASYVFVLFFTPVIVQKTGEKWGMIFGALLFLCFTLALVVYSYESSWEWIILFGSGLVGCGAAVLWVAQGVELANSSTDSSRGEASGLFWLIFQSSGFLGNAAAYFILRNGNTLLYICAACATGAGILTFFALRQPPAELVYLQQREKEALLMPQQITPSDSAIVHVSDEEEVLPAKQVGLLEILQHRNMLLLLPICFLSGFEMSFACGYMPTVFAPEASQQNTIGLVFTVWGICEAVGGYTLGKLSDTIGKKIALILCVCLYLLALVLAWIINNDTLAIAKFPDSKEGVSILAYLMLLLVGLADSMFNVLSYAAVGLLFKGKSTVAAFTWFQIMQNSASGIMFFVPAIWEGAHTQTYIIIQAMYAVFACACFCALPLSKQKTTSN